jgi:hypothetical protein
VIDDFEVLAKEGKNLKNFLKEILSRILLQAQKDLQNGNTISHSLEVLEALQEALMKTKNSFDENLSFKIGLLKILGGGSSLSQPSSQGEKAASLNLYSNSTHQTPLPKPLPTQALTLTLSQGERGQATSAVQLQPHLLPLGEEL